MIIYQSLVKTSDGLIDESSKSDWARNVLKKNEKSSVTQGVKDTCLELSTWDCYFLLIKRPIKSSNKFRFKSTLCRLLWTVLNILWRVTEWNVSWTKFQPNNANVKLSAGREYRREREGKNGHCIRFSHYFTAIQQAILVAEAQIAIVGVAEYHGGASHFKRDHDTRACLGEQAAFE